MFSFCTAHTTNSCSTCVARETFETVFQCPARPWGTKHLCFAKGADGSCGDGTSPNRRHERKTFAPAGSRKDDDLKLHLLLGSNLLSASCRCSAVGVPSPMGCWPLEMKSVVVLLQEVTRRTVANWAWACALLPVSRRCSKRMVTMTGIRVRMGLWLWARELTLCLSHQPPHPTGPPSVRDVRHRGPSWGNASCSPCPSGRGR